MSVRGFNTGTGVERYDYNALDNVPLTTNTRVKGDAEVEYREGDVNLTKANIGLGNVDNTSDADKPISTAQQNALGGKVDKVEGKGLSTNDYTNAEKQRVADSALQLDDLTRQLSDDVVHKDGIAEVTPQNLQIVDATISKNLYNPDEVSHGILSANGTVYSGDYTYTDFIPVDAGSDYFCSQYMSGAQYAMTVRNVCCYDADKNVMPSAGTDTAFTGLYTVPAGVSFIRITNYAWAGYSKWQIEKGNAMTEYEPFGLLGAVIKGEYIPPVEMSSIPAFELTEGQNLWNSNDPDFAVGKFLDVTGSLSDNTGYTTSGFIPVTAGSKIVASYKNNAGETNPATLRTVAAYTAEKIAIGARGAYSVEEYYVPQNIAYIRVCIYTASYGNAIQVQALDHAETYYPYSDYVDPHYLLKQSYMFDLPEAPVNVYLPKDIYVAVGRTIELYNSQIVLDHEKYHFQWGCGKGVAKERKFSITGETVGNLNLFLTLYDDKQRICWRGHSTIHVVSASNPSKKILPIGDSLTNWKAWLQETMLLSENHITWVGTRYSGQSVDSEGNIYPSGEIHSEGRSGWSATDYLTNSTYTFDDRYDGVSSVQGSANPFWDGSKFSLSHYLSVQTGVQTPDAVQIFLGTNDLLSGVEDAIEKITNLVTLIRDEYPEMPIFVCNTIYRSNQNGYGSVGADAYSGGSYAGAWQYNEDAKVMNLAKGLQAALADDSNLHFIPLISCMDREYDFGQVMTKVNPRSNVEVPMPAESVHPQAVGYYQMADLMYSFYCGVLS